MIPLHHLLFVSDWPKNGHVTQIWPIRQKEKSISIPLEQKELVLVLLSFALGNYCEGMMVGAAATTIL